MASERKPKLLGNPSQPLPPAESEEQLSQIAQQLLAANPKNITIVPNQGRMTLARITDVHDGDTIQVLVMLGGVIIKLSVRVRGIDAPEITKRGTTTQQEVEVSKKIRDYVEKLLSSNPLCYIVLECKDVYCGRYVGDIFLPSGERLSEHLLQIGCVKPYAGNKKDPWTCEELSQIDFRMNHVLATLA